MQGQSKISQRPGIGAGRNGAWVTTHALAPGRAKLAGYWPCVGAGWRKKPIITYVLAQGGANSESSPVRLHQTRQVAGHHPRADSGWGNWQVLADVLVLEQSEWRLIAHAFVQDGANGRSSPMRRRRAEQVAGHRPCVCAGRSKWQVIAHAFVQDGANGRSSPMHWCRTGQMAGHPPYAGTGRSTWRVIAPALLQDGENGIDIAHALVQDGANDGSPHRAEQTVDLPVHWHRVGVG